MWKMLAEGRKARAHSDERFAAELEARTDDGFPFDCEVDEVLVDTPGEQ